jgi:RNA polymerase sigma factor (sigma-70 family)
MKEFELEFRIRNNLLKQRRLELGMNQRQFAEAVGIQVNSYCALETMRDSPKGAEGDWRPTALKIAEYHGLGMEELFPDKLLAVEVTSGTKLVDADEISGLLLSDHQQKLLTAGAPDEVVYKNEEMEILKKYLSKLIPRKEKIVRMYYGMDNDEEGQPRQEKNCREIAEEMEITQARAKAIKEHGVRDLQKIAWQARRARSA